MKHPHKFNGELSDINRLHKSLQFLKAQWIMRDRDGWLPYYKDLERKISFLENEINKKKFKHEFK
jgi:hypothetical protein